MSFANELRFKMHRRFAKSEDPTKLYENAYSVLTQLPQPWGLAAVPMKPVPKYVGLPNFGVSYTKQAKASPVKAFHFGYMNRDRSDEPDDSYSNDDSFTVDFYPKKVKEPWEYLVTRVFQTYIRATTPYLGRLADTNIFAGDIDTFNPVTGEFDRNKDYIDPRQGVYRIWPANYWDRELCRRAFHLTPEEIVVRLAGKVADCRVFEAGVLLIYSFSPVLGADILRINDELMPILRVKK